MWNNHQPHLVRLNRNSHLASDPPVPVSPLLLPFCLFVSYPHRGWCIFISKERHNESINTYTYRSNSHLTFHPSHWGYCSFHFPCFPVLFLIIYNIIHWKFPSAWQELRMTHMGSLRQWDQVNLMLMQGELGVTHAYCRVLTVGRKLTTRVRVWGWNSDAWDVGWWWEGCQFESQLWQSGQGSNRCSRCPRLKPLLLLDGQQRKTAGGLPAPNASDLYAASLV